MSTRVISIKITKKWKSLLIRRYGPGGSTTSIKNRMRQAFTFLGIYYHKMNEARIIES